MPLYEFECKGCQFKEEIYLPVKERNYIKPICGQCGEQMIRAISKPYTGRVYGSTFWSQSLAVSPDQTEEHKKLFPSVKVRADGCVGFDNVREHSDYCKKTGFEKMPQKCKGRGKKI